MKIKRASLCQGKGSLSHNLRLFTANNVDKTRTKDNIVFVNIPQQEMYEKLFSGAVSEYNARQKRNDRKITVSYYEHQFGRGYFLQMWSRLRISARAFMRTLCRSAI